MSEFKAGDVVVFYFSERTGFTKEQELDNTKMVDIIIFDKEEEKLVAVSDFGGGCYLHRIDHVATVIGTIHDEDAISELLANGWTIEGIKSLVISYIDPTYRIKK